LQPRLQRLGNSPSALLASYYSRAYCPTTLLKFFHKKEDLEFHVGLLLLTAKKTHAFIAFLCYQRNPWLLKPTFISEQEITLAFSLIPHLENMYLSP